MIRRAGDFEDYRDLLVELRCRGPLVGVTGIGVVDAVALRLVAVDDESGAIVLTPSGFAALASRELWSWHVDQLRRERSVRMSPSRSSDAGGVSH